MIVQSYQIQGVKLGAAAYCLEPKDSCRATTTRSTIPVTCTFKKNCVSAIMYALTFYAYKGWSFIISLQVESEILS
jgi:hypothetical protein